MSLTPYLRGPASDASVFDLGQLNTLKRDIQNGSDAQANKKVAQQFEAMFIQILLKQARQASLLSGPFDSEQTRMAQSMGDEQMALQLSRPGVGLAQALLNQIATQQARGAAAQSAPAQSADASAAGMPGLRPDAGQERPEDAPSISALLGMLKKHSSAGRALSAIKEAPEHIQNFVSAMADAAQAAANRHGVPLKLMLSQAALESGWGKREIQGEDGSPSYNLFGIKAGAGWKGKVVNVLTTEYEDGVAKKVVQPFRAYASYAESFADYGRLLNNSERYQEVMNAPSAQAAARKIQDAGYATDPNYANKLISIMGYFDADAI